MVTMFRLNKKEAEKVRKAAIEANKKRIENGIEPVKDSELLHEILEQAFKKMVITNNGKVSMEL